MITSDPDSNTIEVKNLGRVFKNISALGIVQIVNYIVPLFLLPYLVRKLGVEKFGLIMFIQAFVSYFTYLVDYGFNLSATKKIAMKRSDFLNTVETFWRVTFIKMWLFLLGFVFSSVVVYFSPTLKVHWPIYLITYPAVGSSIIFPIWLFQGLEKMELVTIYAILSRLMVCALIVFFVRVPSDYMIAAGLQSLGMLLPGLIGFRMVMSIIDNQFIMPTLSSQVAELRDGWYEFTSIGAVSLYSGSNTFILGLIGGNALAGYYGMSEKLIRAFQGLMAPITQAIFPYVCNLLVRSRTQTLLFIQKAFWGLLAVNTVLTAMLYFLATPIVRIVFGGGNLYIVPLVKLMALIPMAVAISNIIGIQTMLPFGMKRTFSRILVSGGAVNVILCYFLTRANGALGTAQASVLIEVLISIAMIGVIAKKGLYPWFGKERL